VRMVRDRTGRFAMRPFFEASELDHECESLIRKLLQRRRGKVSWPVTTEDLTVLIEMHDADLDSYADLTRYGHDVEGVTEFFENRGPKVSISERISADDRRENRYRTTLTHEFGHVKFHASLWAEKFATDDLLDRRPHANKAISKRDNILNAPQGDWMEWQAGYISGALLMPAGPVRRLVSGYCAPLGLHGDIHVASEHAENLMTLVIDQFDVSAEAARIRLLKLHLLTLSDVPRSLFDP
jgi:Zn-dependent peptidase ImmA (M78 family)